MTLDSEWTTSHDKVKIIKHCLITEGLFVGVSVSAFTPVVLKSLLHSFQSEVSSRRIRSEEPLSSLNSLSRSDSLSFRRPNLRYQSGLSCSTSVTAFCYILGREIEIMSFAPFLSGADSSSPSHISSDHRDQMEKDAVEGKLRMGGAEEKMEREAGSSSIEEQVFTAANDSLCSDSIPSIVDEKGIGWPSQLLV